MQFKFIALLTLAVASVSGAALDKGSGTCTCAGNYYSSYDTEQAIYYAQSGSYDGYPHQYKNYEKFKFKCHGHNYYEFPILEDRSYYHGSKPGPDRVVYDDYGEFCGCITHTGASGNGFKKCKSE